MALQYPEGMLLYFRSIAFGVFRWDKKSRDSFVERQLVFLLSNMDGISEEMDSISAWTVVK